MKTIENTRPVRLVGRGLYTDLITLLRRTSEGGGFDDVATVASWTPFKVYGFIKPMNSSANIQKLAGQTVSEQLTHYLTLPQYPKDFDKSWRVEHAGKMYRVSHVGYADRSKLMLVGLTELGLEEHRSSYE